MAYFDLRGHKGRPLVAHDHSTPFLRPHAKNQQPGFETVAVHRGQTLQLPTYF